MSLELLGKVFNVQGLSPLAKNVLKSLANHAWDDGTHAHPSIGLIVHETSASKASVSRGMTELKDKSFIKEAGATSLGVKVYTIDVGRVEECLVKYIPKKRWGTYPEMPQSQNEATPSQIETRTLIEPLDNNKQKTYAPETEELYNALLKGWQRCFPLRVQPRVWSKASTKLKDHVAARSQEEDFVTGWRKVMWDKRHSALAEAGWFTLEYFCRNEDNWQGIRAGKFDFLGDGSVTQPVGVAPDITIEQWQNRRK